LDLEANLISPPALQSAVNDALEELVAISASRSHGEAVVRGSRWRAPLTVGLLSFHRRFSGHAGCCPHMCRGMEIVLRPSPGAANEPELELTGETLERRASA